jgi:hypothetical protein
MITNIFQPVSVVLLKLTLVLSITLAAPAEAIPSDTEAWALIGATARLGPESKYSLYFEAQPRLGDDLGQPSTVQVRGALNRELGMRWVVSIGYAWTPLLYDAQYRASFRDEHRSWQGLSYSYEYLGIKWLSRIRQEQRYIEGVDAVINRSRYQVRSGIPFVKSDRFGLAISNEVMFNVGSTGGALPSGYDRNRFFLGPYLVQGKTRYEFGYLAEHAKRFGDEQRLVNAVLLSAVTDLS